jgi:hypothetical protein
MSIDGGPVKALRYRRGDALPKLDEDQQRGLRRSVLWAYRLLLARGRQREASAVEERNRDKFLAVYPDGLPGFVASVPRGNTIRCLVIPGTEWYEVRDWQQFCEYAGDYLAEVTDSVTVRMDGVTFTELQRFLADHGEDMEVKYATADMDAIDGLVAAGVLPVRPVDVVRKKSSTQVRLEWGKVSKNPA